MIDLAAGTRLGTYAIVRKLGEGAMGLVYEARHEVLGRRAAVKMLRAELAQNPQVAPRFLQEARAANLVTHENVVSVFDFGETADGVPYFVMEYLEGETLHDRLRRHGRMPARDVVHVFGQVLRALQAAHGQRVIHRDLKPANVFIMTRGDDPLFVKVLDFGIAKLQAEVGLTKTGMVLGTPSYMSPEQISGHKTDARTDLFSVGVMLYEATTGTLPFAAPTLEALAVAITSHTPPAPSTTVIDVPAALDRVVMTALQKDPARRYPDARTMFEALEGVFPREGPAVRPRPRSRAPLFVAGGLVAAGAVTIAIVAPRPATSAAPDAAVARVDSADAAEVLRRAVTAPDLGEATDAVAALSLAGGPRTAAFLYPALDRVPELRRQAALALARIGVPEAAARVRAAIDKSGDQLRVDLAYALALLGNKEVVAILERGLDQPRVRLSAALGLLAAGKKEAAQPVLAQFVDDAPRGHEDWLRAAEGLAAHGDEKVRALLREELTQPDAARAVAAAAALARAGDDSARGALQRLVADKDFARRGEAALALARLGDRAALAFVRDGLASAAPEDRRLAAAVAGALHERSHAAALTHMMTSDPDRRARLCAAAALVDLGQGP